MNDVVVVVAYGSARQRTDSFHVTMVDVAEQMHLDVQMTETVCGSPPSCVDWLL